MDRFFHPLRKATAHTASQWQIFGRHGMFRVLIGVGSLALASTVNAALPSLIVQLKPGTSADLQAATSVVRVESPQAVREQAKAVWERAHAIQVTRLGTVASQTGVSINSVSSAGNALRVDLPAGTTAAGLDAAAQRLRAHPDVLAVVPNDRLRPTQTSSLVPNDPQFTKQWHMQPATTTPGAANMPGAWSRFTGATSPFVVAVVDTGVRYEHPDLAGRLLPGYDMISDVDVANDGDGRDSDASDPGDWISEADAKLAVFEYCGVSESSWHGTAIAGVIAAVGNNSVGVAGVNWGAKIVPVRIGGKCGALTSDLLDGLRWAAGLPVSGAPVNANPAKVINLSFGGAGSCNTVYQTTLDSIAAAGSLVFIAAGNSSAQLTRPADCTGAITVAAVRADGTKSYFSSFGSNVTLSAPGGSALSDADQGLTTTINLGTEGPTTSGYGAVAGTSFAAPMAAGVASLMWAMEPTVNSTTLQSLLLGALRPHIYKPDLVNCYEKSVIEGACNCTSQTCGAGLLDGTLGVNAMLARQPSTPTPPVASSGGGGATSWWWGAALWAWVLVVGRGRKRLV